MLIAFVYLISKKAGSFLIQDLYDLDLTRTEQFWYSHVLLTYAIKIPFNSFHTWQVKVYQKAPAGNDALSGIMLKMGLYSVIVGSHQSSVAAENVFNTLGFSIGGFLVWCKVKTKKDLKKLLAYSSPSTRRFNCSWYLYFTFDGLRGAVLQMILTVLL
jgi:NADH-quinone oxidoreductase subunit M